MYIYIYIYIYIYYIVLYILHLYRVITVKKTTYLDEKYFRLTYIYIIYIYMYIYIMYIHMYIYGGTLCHCKINWLCVNSGE